jgi:hypothetical protein
MENRRFTMENCGIFYRKKTFSRHNFRLTNDNFNFTNDKKTINYLFIT